MKREFLYCSLALLLVANIKAEEYGLNSQADTDTVFFRSPARLEFIQGKTNYIKGNFQFNPQNPREKISGVLKVDLRTLNTGIETRDEHMREKHLHTDKYPFAYFELLEFDDIPDRIILDSNYTLIGGGYFYIHGIKRKIYPNITFSIHENSEGSIYLNIQATFDMKLDEFKINRPRALFLKLAETIKVEVVFTGYNNMKTEPIKLPDWQEIP